MNSIITAIIHFVERTAAIARTGLAFNPHGFDAERYGQATALFTEVALADDFADFLTIPAYERMP